MRTQINHHEVQEALRRSGSNWSAAQAHGLLCSRLAVMGAEGGPDWFALILEDSDPGAAEHSENVALIDDVYAETYRQLVERQSDFAPLLPDDSESPEVVATGLAEWCEGFLHGLVTDVKATELKQKLAASPLSDIIRDLLEMTRATVDEDEDDDAIDEALTELVEYLRVAAQLVYEELAELRHPDENKTAVMPESDAVH